MTERVPACIGGEKSSDAACLPNVARADNTFHLDTEVELWI